MATGKTTIGRTIEIEGEVHGEEDLIIQGKVQGVIQSRENLIIETSGHVQADVNTKNLDVSGKLVGNVEASEKVEIKTEGTMIGDIKAPRILISDGAKFKGKIEMDLDS